MAYKKWLQTRTTEDRSLYKAKRSQAKAAVAKAKSACYDRVYQELNTRAGENNIYRLAKARHRATQDIEQVKNIKDSNHQLLQDDDAILKRWNAHFAQICREEFPHSPIPSGEPVLGPVPAITEQEVANAIKKTKNNRAPALTISLWKPGS